VETNKDSVICVGFPSPAANYMEETLDLNEYLIKHPSATFFVRVTGDAMIEAGIHSGDVLIVDRSLEPADNKVVIAVVNGQFMVRRVRIVQGKLCLVPEDRPLELDDKGTDVEIWGVVTNVIHPL
jgi:DNA polymerase V